MKAADLRAGRGLLVDPVVARDPSVGKGVRLPDSGHIDPSLLGTGYANDGSKFLADNGKYVKFARSTGTLTFTASATSANLTVAHGLGVTPTTILAQVKTGIAFCFIQIISVDATNIVFQGHDTGGTSRTGTNDFYWLAIP